MTEREKEFAPLRTEIVESEKVRIDLLKYKLITIATLSAVGLGLSEKIDLARVLIEPVYVLCIIPFVCIFVDSLCMHNSLRILVIAKFLEKAGDQYEMFVSDLRNSKHASRFIFSLEDWALQYSSILVSGILIGIGIHKNTCILIITGVIGVMIILALYVIFRWLKNSI